ncbi:endonuclease/exonuclease/phosphatase family protein [Actinomadura rudentiformis]|uniref:Endonuclease/exonuclease/phosphatase domain-containing protein n=1 Tax=Actinomadura rudentiformis TaxID=359158 RepID=A0A6H9Z2T3_9ACTN|nr:endonuclease/exonuclease/phosphatase family protein [Actinomadura rudentiformis]KAB2348586.1 hypothetical protein F8566_17605 [Actinomadura rudentiformis]
MTAAGTALVGVGEASAAGPAPASGQRAGRPAAPVSAQPTQSMINAIRIHHYNLCAGNTDKCGAYPDALVRARNLVVKHVVADKPLFLSLNEVCKNDVGEVVQRIRDEGYNVDSVMSVTTQHNQCEDRGGDYGNAIIYRSGTREDGSKHDEPYPAGMQQGERRTMLCVRLRTDVGAIAACTTHLAAGEGVDPDTPKRQADEYKRQATVYAAGRKRVLAGDFNKDQYDYRTPHDEAGELYPTFEPGLQNLVSGYVRLHPEEVDAGVERRDKTFPATAVIDGELRKITPTRQIDHIWVDDRGMVIKRKPICDHNGEPASDHCYTMGEWVLGLPGTSRHFTVKPCTVGSFGPVSRQTELIPPTSGNWPTTGYVGFYSCLNNAVNREGGLMNIAKDSDGRPMIGWRSAMIAEVNEDPLRSKHYTTGHTAFDTPYGPAIWATQYQFISAGTQARWVLWNLATNRAYKQSDWHPVCC